MDRLQIIVVAKKDTSTCRNCSSGGCLKCVQFHNSTIPQLVSAPLNPIPIAEHFMYIQHRNQSWGVAATNRHVRVLGPFNPKWGMVSCKAALTFESVDKILWTIQIKLHWQYFPMKMKFWISVQFLLWQRWQRKHMLEVGFRFKGMACPL